MDAKQFAQQCVSGEESHRPESTESIAGGWIELIPIILTILKNCDVLKGKSNQAKHKWIERHPRQARRAIIRAAIQRGCGRHEAETIADRMLEEMPDDDQEFSGIVTSLSTGVGT